MFCKGMGLEEMPRLIEEFPDISSSGSNMSSKPFLRLHMPHNRLNLRDTTFANIILEKL